MARKLRWECPCGFSFETIRGENEAVTLLQLHVERVHEGYLPFGITRVEALTLLKQVFKPKENQELTPNVFCARATLYQMELT